MLPPLLDQLVDEGLLDVRVLGTGHAMAPIRDERIVMLMDTSYCVKP
jgi:hypothetical protein